VKHLTTMIGRGRRGTCCALAARGGQEALIDIDAAGHRAARRRLVQRNLRHQHAKAFGHEAASLAHAGKRLRPISLILQRDWRPLPAIGALSRVKT
jgi:hypothetical protein